MNNSVIRGALLFFLLTIYIFNGLCIVLSIQTPLFDYAGISFLGIFSILLFTGIIILCTFYHKLFFFFLPFVLLAFPNVINDFFPAFMLGPLTENRVASFPFITHIDIFLIFGLLIFKDTFPSELRFEGRITILFSLLIFSSFFLITLFLTKENHLLSLFAVGDFQFRYLLLFTLYLVSVKINPEHIQMIVFGLSFSVLFLFVEAYAFSFFRGYDYLVSGTLAANVFANIIAAITVFYIFYPTTYFSTSNRYFQLIRFTTISIGFLILILNGTRMAMLSLLLSGGFYYVKTTFNTENLLRFLARLLGYGLLFGFLILIAIQFDRFKSIILIFSDMANLEFQFNEDTASLFARFQLYLVSANMIDEHWLMGIGPGRWNFLKYDYGFRQMGTLLTDVLLDPHNDYLSYLSQYGIFGILFIVFLYIFPSTQFISNPKNPFAFFGIIPLTLMFSSFTNSNTLKHNVFALSGMILFLILQIYIRTPNNNQLRDA